jgi:hypothetical protein
VSEVLLRLILLLRLSLWIVVLSLLLLVEHLMLLIELWILLPHVRGWVPLRLGKHLSLDMRRDKPIVDLLLHVGRWLSYIVEMVDLRVHWSHLVWHSGANLLRRLSELVCEGWWSAESRWGCWLDERISTLIRDTLLGWMAVVRVLVVVQGHA